MKLEGAYTVPAPREVVWRALMDPQILARALPGCEKMEPNPDGSYRAELKVGIGAVRGTYHGRVQILDPVPLERYRMKVEGKGTGGFVNGEGTLVVSDDPSGGTTIRYTGDAQVGGVIASVGQRLLQGATHKIVSQFFDAFAKQLQSSQPAGRTSVEAQSSPPSQS